MKFNVHNTHTHRQQHRHCVCVYINDVSLCVDIDGLMVVIVAHVYVCFSMCVYECCGNRLPVCTCLSVYDISVFGALHCVYVCEQRDRVYGWRTFVVPIVRAHEHSHARKNQCFNITHIFGNHLHTRYIHFYFIYVTHVVLCSTLQHSALNVCYGIIRFILPCPLHSVIHTQWRILTWHLRRKTYTKNIK